MRITILLAAVVGILGAGAVASLRAADAVAQNGLATVDVNGLRCAFVPPLTAQSNIACVVASGLPTPSPIPSAIPTNTPVPTATPVPTNTPVPGAVAAQITSPAPGANIGGSTLFTWDAGIGATQYWLWVSTVPGDGNVYSQTQGAALSATVNVPTTGAVYVRLWSFVNGAWLYHDYQYA